MAVVKLPTSLSQAIWHWFVDDGLPTRSRSRGETHVRHMHTHAHNEVGTPYPHALYTHTLIFFASNVRLLFCCRCGCPCFFILTRYRRRSVY